MFATDPNGRRVELTYERWQHILDGHPELAPFRSEVLRAIREPLDVHYDARAGDWFYVEWAGPSRWLKVVVAFDEQDSGSVCTAFPTRSNL